MHPVSPEKPALSRTSRFGALAAIVVATLAATAPSAAAEELWLSQGASACPVEALNVNVSNTSYFNHGRHFANEEATSFRWQFAEQWSAGAGITWGQGKSGKCWNSYGRPTENVSLDWTKTFSGWTVFNAQRFDLKFREGERDWVIYRNIGSLSAPPLECVPWNLQPYISEQFYISSRECYTGFDRFCQLRLGAGVRLSPAECLSLAAYWQYLDIEDTDGSWDQTRVAGLAANLKF